ncbi:hypothetical protein AKJ16_DCAP08936 [Drosera capensis]
MICRPRVLLVTVQAAAHQVYSTTSNFRGRDSPNDVRNTLLVIAVLVATASFQVAVNPPGSVWQQSTTIWNNVYPAGVSVLGSTSPRTFILFMGCNSIGFAVSICMIAMLTTCFQSAFRSGSTDGGSSTKSDPYFCYRITLMRSMKIRKVSVMQKTWRFIRREYEHRKLARTDTCYH